MSKLALGVNKSDVIKIIPDLENYKELTLSAVKPSFFSLPSHIRDRADCETDETFLQFIPYITLISSIRKFSLIGVDLLVMKIGCITCIQSVLVAM